MHSLGPDQLRGYVERFVGDHSANHLGSKGPSRGVRDGTAGPQRISLQKSGPGQSGYQVHDEDVTAAEALILAADALRQDGRATLSRVALRLRQLAAEVQVPGRHAPVQAEARLVAPLGHQVGRQHRRPACTIKRQCTRPGYNTYVDQPQLHV